MPKCERCEKCTECGIRNPETGELIEFPPSNVVTASMLRGGSERKVMNEKPDMITPDLPRPLRRSKRSQYGKSNNTR